MVCPFGHRLPRIERLNYHLSIRVHHAGPASTQVEVNHPHTIHTRQDPTPPLMRSRAKPQRNSGNGLQFGPSTVPYRKNFPITVGFRLCCLLLVPMRLWPALALGESLPVLENAFACIDDFGPAWVLAAAVPQIVVCMAGMKPLRRWGALRCPDGRLRMGCVIAATLCCALLSTLRDTTSLMALSTDGSPGPLLWVGFSAYLLGGYLGGLTLVPTMLAL